jgi:hypothetical protein
MLGPPSSKVRVVMVSTDSGSANNHITGKPLVGLRMLTQIKVEVKIGASE